MTFLMYWSMGFMLTISYAMKKFDGLLLLDAQGLTIIMILWPLVLLAMILDDIHDK